MLFNAVSDETLYTMMAQGNAVAHDTLMMRYDTVGRQMALSMIRIYGVFNKKVQDYYDTIYDSINKAFRYYSIDDSKFYPFIYEILKQNLYRVTQDYLQETRSIGNVVSLDSKINSSDNTFYDVIGEKDDESSNHEFDINDLINKFSLSSNSRKRLIACVFVLYKQGYSISEIAAITGRSKYAIRKIFENGKDYFDGDYMI